MAARGPAWWRRLLGTGRARRPPPATQPPATLADWQVLGLLGRGTVGEVHLAVEPGTGRRVALKTFAFDVPDGEAMDQARARFLNEARAAGRLDHPDIVGVVAAGESGGRAWIAMELVDGCDLSRYTARARLLPEAVVLRIGVRLARALAHAHAHGVVHRDVKPANVRVDLARDVVKLGDFGVARLDDAARTRTGLVLGTPAYMAPEQLAGGSAEPAADLHALGVVLFELLTGRLPYRGSSLGELMRSLAHDPVPDLGAFRPDLPPALAAVLARAMAKDPRERTPDGEQLSRELEAVLHALPPGGSA